MSNQYHENPRSSHHNGSWNGNNRYNGERYYGGEMHPVHADSGDEIDLKHLFSVGLRYKWIILSITFLVTGLAVAYAYSLLPIYESSGTIQISESRQAGGEGSDLENILRNSFGIGRGNNLINEMEVFRSRVLSLNLADKIITQDRMENGERFPILWAQYPEDSTIISRDTLAVRLRENMQVDRIDRDADILRITYKSYSPLEAAWLVNSTIETYSEFSSQQNRMAANAALEFLDGERAEAQQRLSESEEALRGYMNQTNLVEVDGQTSAVIGRLAELESQRQQVQVEKVAVSSSVASYEGQLEEIRPGLAEQFAENVGSTMERAQYRLAELETERNLILQRNPSLRNNPEQEPYLVQQEEQIRIVKEEINQLAAELVSGDSDAYLGFLRSGEGGVSSQVMDIRSRLLELRVQESQLQAQEEVIARRMEEENAFFDGLPTNMMELARLKRDAQVNEQIYLTISQQHSETALWEQTQFGSGRPIDAGYIPDRPSEPRKKLYAAVGFLLGGILSFGFVFVRENTNRTIDGTEKLLQSGYELLALIPDKTKHIREHFKGKAHIQVEGRDISTTWSTLVDNISPEAEAYRRLHNNIIYSHPNERFQTILVTSSVKGEGKSTVSINLASTLAEAGKKVLLLDTDLRRPSIHNLTGEPREPGLTGILQEGVTEMEAIRASVAPGLDILTSGQNAPNPSALMQNQKMGLLLQKLKQEYDYIVIDTPPYGIISDVAPLMRMVDGVVLVARFGQTKTNELNHTIKNLERIHSNVIGTVITCYLHKQSTDYYYSNEYSSYSYDSYKAYQEYQEKS